ncbi:MAG: TetR/AcrR family transcriptional regulator [Eubacteriaceae bacterium]|nr:TetR/AcrR family transcriptional regulator [Eubacteriaceae bacterium]
MEQGNNQKSLKSQQTRAKIIDTYLDLIVDKKWDKITVKEICEGASITRGTFYQYFEGIYDLMEQIENALFTEIKARYAAAPPRAHVTSTKFFEETFDCNPPYILTSWFEFCKNNSKAMSVMLDPKHGDTYFVKRLKVIIDEQLHSMMDADGLPNDALRHHFVKVFIELHFLAARSWMSANDTYSLTDEEVISLLNSMRVGISYLTYKGENEKEEAEKSE